MKLVDALALIGLSRSSYFERCHPGHRRVDNPTAPAQRNSAIAYSLTECEEIARQLNQAPTLTVSQVYHQHLDAGKAIASERTYYRVARSVSCPTRGPVCRSTRTSNTPTVEPPKLKATRAFEVICWDITFLPLLERGKHLALHMAIDLFSREIVGFGFATNPNADIARAMFTEVITLAGGNDATITVVHSDNGKTMKSVKLCTLLAENNITKSHSRPRVSDDNPYIESTFATLKGDIDYPGVFDDAAHAIAWVSAWIEFYNTQRFHPKLAHFTPRQVRDGSWQGNWAIRNAHKQAHYEANPARYRGRRPQVPRPKSEVHFNIHNTPDGHTSKNLATQLLT